MKIRKAIGAIGVAVVLSISSQDAVGAQLDMFDEQIAATKSLVMGDPNAALAKTPILIQLANTEVDANKRALKRATAQWLRAESLVRLNRSAEALPIVSNALDSISTLPKAKLHGDLLRTRGNAYLSMGKVQLALPDLQAAHDLYREAREPRGQAMALMDIGTIYQNAGDYERVLQYYKQAEEAYKFDSNLLYAMYNNRALLYIGLGKFAQAEDELKKALNISIKLNKHSLQIISYSNISGNEIAQGNFRKAEKYAQLGLKLSNTYNVKYELPFLYGNMAEIKFKKKI
ncbi:MAG: hypothetical protein CGW95_14290 [Phenylobacterium zucineum]|nr:MAG: hypothetical protein CGW95_14290 [Phenylobacterium zucineum]